MRRSGRSIGAALACTFVLASSAAAGPPWISVEYPSNPHERTTRGALFLVHTFHHGTLVERALTASFEGIVDGQRRTIAATVEPTHRAGVFAVRGTLPATGRWIAVVRNSDDEAPAAALVTLDDAGAVIAIDVPTDRNREGWYIPRAVGEEDIARALRAASGLALQNDDDGRSLHWAGVVGLLAVCAGAASATRTRRHTLSAAPR